MKGIYLIFILSIICQPFLFSQVVVKRNNQVSKEAANVNWSKEFTLFDYTTDEPIFPLIRNGQSVYKIYYASKEDLRPNYGEFSVTQVEGLKYYKFKNRETCLKFCLANKLIAVPTLTTSSISALTTTSAASGGNITSDGGATITARGVVWSTTTNPTIALTTKTLDGTVTGSFSSTLTNLTPKTTYYVRAYATNSTGTGYGNEISFITLDSTIVMGIPCPGTPKLKDIDGNTYNTVQIGTQCWTKENLRVTKYRDGTVIPLDETGGVEGNGSELTSWIYRSTGARTVYGHSATNLATYGYLYNWYAATDTKGLCPSGWHLPSDEEWTNLTNYLGGESVAGGKMKSIGTIYWISPNAGATNESGFSALPSGYRDFSFTNIRNYASFWSATAFDFSYAWVRYLNSFLGNVNRYSDNQAKTHGFSVRCLKDTNSIVSIPTLTTTAITEISTTSATSGGVFTSDGGASITAGGVVWATTINPTIALITKTTDGTGTGSFTSNLTNLTPKTNYYLRAYATNSAGTGYGNEISFTTSDSSNVMGIPCPGTPSVKDIDGNTYNTVQIGTQCWTKENLRVTKYSDGSVISLDESGGTTGNGTGQTWSSRITGARTVYGHSASNLATYGYLYNWYAVADTKGLCPSGWHVPSDSELTTLTNYLGGGNVAGGKMKSAGTTFWNSPNLGATNESGFSALPSGYRDINGSFSNISNNAFFWSTTGTSSINAWVRHLDYSGSYVGRVSNYYMSFGASVRCLKDTTLTISTPNITTTGISLTTTTSATSGGNITADGGASITARGVVWSTTTNPTITLTTKTSNSTGTGSFTSTLTNLAPKTTYYVRAYATNSAGTGYGNEITFTTLDSSNVMGIPCPGTPTVKDIDGNTYNTVQIGTQCWTKENLRVTKYRDGSVIPLDESGGTAGNGTGQTWSSRTTGARTVYGHNAGNLATYGYLYNWYAAVDSKGLCPSGWHIPLDGEWTILIKFLDNNANNGIASTFQSFTAGGTLKELGTTYWEDPNKGATNESGFSALPSGNRYSDGEFGRIGNIKSYCFFWSATVSTNLFYALGRDLYSTNSYIGMNANVKSVGGPVRCLKDTFSIVSAPTLTTTAITSITTTSSTSGGNITSVGGASITARGVVWSTSINPTISVTTKTADGTGTGSFSSTLTNLTPKTTYFVRAYATNSAGTGYGNEISFITSDSTIVMGIPCPGTPTVKDIDENTYNTVQIGTQCWTKENLRVTKYRDGNQIPLVTVQSVWSNLTTDARSWYNNDSTNYENPHGKLYNWYATSDLRGICPSGWHVPSEQEWTFLCQFLDSSTYYTWGSQSFIAGGKLKTTGTDYWNSPNQGATNFSGFAALPSGARSSNSIGNGFYHFKDGAYFWSSSQYQSNDAFHVYLSNTNTRFYTNISFKTSGFSIRCIKDTSSVAFSIPTLTTASASALTTSTSTSGGNITSDGGSSITTRGVVWSTTTNPTISLSTKTIDGIGTGTFTSALTGLIPKTTYYVRAYATNSAGTGYGNEISFTTSDSTIVMGIPCPGTPTVKDIDGNTYNTVQIGTQCWTKENLRVTKYRDGSVIPLDESGGTAGNGTGQTWSSRTTGARTVYGHSAANLATYGYLYNWYAVADTKGLCPTGWHVPSDDEWTILVTYLGGESIAGGKMKSTGTTYWNSPNTGATNEIGFSALPGGYRNNDGRYNNISYNAFFWSGTELDSSLAWYRYLSSASSKVYRGNYLSVNYNYKSVGAFVRCLMD